MKNYVFPFVSALICTNFHFVQVRLRLGQANLKNKFFILLTARLALTFAWRRKLGCARLSPIKNKFFLAFALAYTNFVLQNTADYA